MLRDLGLHECREVLGMAVMNAAEFRKVIKCAIQQATKPNADGSARTPTIQMVVFVGSLEGQLIGFNETELANCLSAVGRPVAIGTTTAPGA